MALAQTGTTPAGNGVLFPSGAKALLIDGKRASEQVIARVTENARTLAAQGLKPGLAVVLVGDDPASQVYVKSKSKAAQACGFHSANMFARLRGAKLDAKRAAMIDVDYQCDEKIVRPGKKPE